MALKTIIWDIDDVLNDFTRSWFESWRRVHPECHANYEDLKENPPHRQLGINKMEYLTALDEFRLSDEAARMVPDVRIVNWFKKNGRLFRHVALTARPRKTVAPAFEWVLRYFGKWIQTFSFVPADRPGESPGHPDRDKSDFLLWLGKADYFIDDNPGNIAAAGKLGVETFLVDRPWNQQGRDLADILANGLGK